MIEVQNLNDACALAAVCGGRVEVSTERILVYEPGDELPAHVLNDAEREDPGAQVVPAITDPEQLERYEALVAAWTGATG